MKNCLVITLEKVYESVLHNNMLKLADNIVSDHKHDFNSENILLPSKWRYRVFHFNKVHQLMLELNMELHPTFPHQMCLKGLEYRLLWLWCYFKCLYLCFLSSFFWFSLMMQMECLWWCWYQSIIKQPMFANLMSHFILLIFNCLNPVFLPVQTENKVMSMGIWLNYNVQPLLTPYMFLKTDMLFLLAECECVGWTELWQRQQEHTKRRGERLEMSRERFEILQRSCGWKSKPLCGICFNH